VAALKAQLADANDKYLRMLAEYDNFRRRSVKERQGVWNDAVAQTLKDLLPIADNLDRAAHATGDAEAIRQGLDMTLKAMTDMFARLGIEVYGKVGEPFDPTYHNAVMHVDDETLGDNVIAEVFQVGYRLGEKVIRYAMVKVAN
jgi:molecular chaperone GrpE